MCSSLLQGRVFLQRKQKSFHLNIGVLIFGAIFVYLIITIILYLTAHHVSSYFVTAGTLSKNETYTALVLRTEKVINADTNGYVHYLVSDSAKAGKGETVCCINDSAAVSVSRAFLPSDLSAIRQEATRFSYGYNGNDFQSVYDFRYSLDSSILKRSEASAISGSLYTSDQAGVVVYSCDGFEGKTVNDVTKDDFQSKSYRKEILRTEDQVSSGQPLFKLVSSENWSVMIPLTNRQYTNLSSRDSVTVLFEKDGLSETGTLSFSEIDGQYYAQIKMTSGMIRYCSDRYLNIELVTNVHTGLKIPVTSIVKKDFFTIPESFLTSGGENGEAGFIKEYRNEEGEKITSFVEATLYEKILPENSKEEVYYVDSEDFSKGDVIIQPDSSRRYTISDKAALEGVYSMNKGYAIFRKIQIIDQNEEYCIVKEGTQYGISQFDYIVRNGNEVNEEDILYQGRFA